MFSGIIQVFVAIALIIIMFIIAFSVYNMEFLKAIQDFGKVRSQTNVFVGIKDLNNSKHEQYNTIDPSSPSYLPIRPSVNQNGGSEYSYNFWLYLDPVPGNKKTNAFSTPNSNNIQLTDGGIESLLISGKDGYTLSDNPVVLFMKGSTVMYNYNTLCNDGSNNKIKTDVLIKAPLVKLEQGCDKLTVEFNTYANPEGVVEGARNRCGETNTNWDYMNAYKIGIEGLATNIMYKKYWFMVTIVIQDTLPSDPSSIRNKIHAMIYVNGTPQFDRYIDGTLSHQSQSEPTINKITNADFYVNPEISTKGTNIYLNQGGNGVVQLQNQQVDYSNPNYSVDQAKSIMMSDLSYFNYALDGENIGALFNKGITKQYAPNILSTNKVGDNDFMDQISYSTNKPTLNQIGVSN
jgi:hypothetical protein